MKDKKEEKENNTDIDFIKIIIDNAEKKFEKEEDKKSGYINKNLYQFYEAKGMKLNEAIKLFKQIYPEFSKEEFMDYVVDHTSDTDIIYNEKLKLEEKINRINWQIIQLDAELGIENERTAFTLKHRTTPTIKEKIEKIKEKYDFSTDIIEAEEGQELSEDEIQEYTEIIEAMVESSSNVKELYKLAKEQMKFFDGMGELYTQILDEKSQEFKQYIDYLGSVEKKELKEVNQQKEKFEKQRNELVELKDGLQKCIDKRYDPKLEEERRGTKKDRENYVEKKSKDR